MKTIPSSKPGFGALQATGHAAGAVCSWVLNHHAGRREHGGRHQQALIEP